MLVNRDIIENYLHDHIKDLIFDNKNAQKLYMTCFKKYNIPGGLVADYVTERKRIEEATDFILFIILDCLYEIKYIKSNMILKYFTTGERDFYSKSKFEDDSKIKFPIVFKVIQVAPDQYIGKTDVRTLMQLKNSQLVKYNENTQRIKQRIVRGEKEYWRITLNKAAVSQIAESLEENRYISDDITLNIPDGNADFYYDEKTCTLTINSIEEFHIIDGYHRWVSMNRVVEKEKDFNYPMELRITCFDEDKAKNFVFQKDQKTRMSKIDSDSFNMNDIANVIVTRLNENVRFNLKGAIKHNGGLISPSDLSVMIKFFYLKNTKENERILIQKVTKDLVESFNILTDGNYELLEHNFVFKELLAIMYVFSLYKYSDKTNLQEDVEIAIEAIKTIDSKKISRRKMTTTMVKYLQQAIKEKGGLKCVQ